MTTMPSWPTVKHEICLDAPNDPAGLGVWLDVTQYVTAFSTKRGRQDETSDVGPDTMQWKLINKDGAFDPEHAGSGTGTPDASSGAHTGTLLGSVLPTLVASPWTGGSYTGFSNAMLFDGVDRGYANTGGIDCGLPSAGVPDVSGVGATFTIEAKIKPAGLGTTYQAIAGRWGDSATLGSNSILLYVGPTGQLILNVMDASGTVHTAGSGGTVMTNGNTYDVSGVYDGTNIFICINGTQLGFTNCPSVAAAPSTRFQIGRADYTAATSPFAGTIEEVRFSAGARYSGAGYTPPTSPFTSDANTRALYHFDSTVLLGGSPYYPNLKRNRQARTTLTWPVSGGTTYTLFRGYEDTGWPQTYESDGRYGYCTPTFVSALTLLGRIPLLDCVLDEMLVDVPTALYPLSDGGSPPLAGNIAASLLPLPSATIAALQGGASGTYAFGASSIVPTASGMTALQTTDVVPINSVGTGRFLSFPVFAIPGLVIGGTGATWTTWATITDNVTPGGASQIMVGSWTTAAGQATIILGHNANGTAYASIANGGAPQLTASGPVVNDGLPHHFAITLNVAQTAITLYVDGRIVGTSSTVTAINATARNYMILGSCSATAPVGTAMTATTTTSCFGVWQTPLTAARIFAHYRAGLDGFNGEIASARINRLLSYASWLPALKSIDTTTNGDADTGLLGATDLAGQTILGALQQTAKSVVGDLDVTADGKVRYRSRDYRLNQTAATVTFGEGVAAGGSSSEVPYTGAPDIAPKRDQIMSAAQVSQRGGITITRGDAQSALDNVGQTGTFDVILADPGQVIDYADENVRRYKDAHQRVGSLVCVGITNPTIWPSLLGLDFGTRVRVMRRQTAAPAKQLDGYIESITHDVAASTGGTKWNVTYTTSPVPPQQGFLLDDATYGLLDSTASVLTF